MDTNQSFTDRSNAKRAARRMVEKGTAPSATFEITPVETGGFIIAWTNIAVPPAAETKSEPDVDALSIAEFAKTPEAQANQAGWDNMLEKAKADGWPNTDPSEAGAPVDDAKREPDVKPPAAPEAAGAAVEPPPASVGTSSVLSFPLTLGETEGPLGWRVLNANGAEFAVAEHREAAELIVRSVNRAAPKKADRPRRVREPSVREPRVSKASALDEAAARGVMPEKPVIKSPTNQHYQKRFDKLAELAAADDWEAIAGYEVRGNNTYAKDLARYRDRLLAAHAAAQPA